MTRRASAPAQAAPVVEVDSGKVLEAQINSILDDFYLVGYSHGTSGGAAPKPKIIKWVEVDPYGP